MKTRFSLRDVDHALIASAIQLGEWLLRQTEATPEHRAAIPQLLAALRKLPEPTLGIDLSFGLDLGIKNADGTALNRAWRVGLYQPESEPLQLVIFSTWTPYPPGPADEELQHEVDFALSLGEPAIAEEHCFKLWGKEVAAMDQLKSKSAHFEIEAEAVPRA